MQVTDQGAVSELGYEMVKNDRMAGYVPSYAGQKTDEFGFLDLLDMVNPLQHLPVVNVVYRAITGDEIKPISQIIGGAVFGGPAGVAGGLVNAVIREETGRDIDGHVRRFAQSAFHRRDDVQVDMEQEHIAYNDLPASLLGFAQMPLLVAAAERRA